MFIIQSLPLDLPQNIGRIAQMIIKIICSAPTERVHFVCYSYGKSIKNVEEHARGTNERSFHITGPDQLRPKDFRQALKSANLCSMKKILGIFLLVLSQHPQNCTNLLLDE